MLLKLLLFCLFIPFSSFGQEYGLEFAGQPNSKDQRTKLDLNPEGYYSFRGEFELSFSIQLRDIQPATFGYIARIVDIDNQNIDIILMARNHIACMLLMVIRLQLFQCLTMTRVSMISGLRSD